MVTTADDFEAEYETDAPLPQVFEIAWEVANKVGGIYTVLRTKAPSMQDEYPGRYALLGPLIGGKFPLEVEETELPAEFGSVGKTLLSQGIKMRCGRWLIEGNPIVFLFDISMNRINQLKGDFWSCTGLSLPPADAEVDNAIAFGYCVYEFLNAYARENRDILTVAHFHEWQASVGLILLKARLVPISLVFTTHATILGRYLCAGDADFYNHLPFFDSDKEAGDRNIFPRYSLEKAAAHSAEVFTTVSHVTAFEAENLLKRPVDGVLPNGLNVVKFSPNHQFQNLHATAKERIHEFIEGHFYSHIDFERDNTLYFFIAGLDNLLKRYNSPMTVVAFIIMPAPTNNYNVETLKGQALSRQLKNVVEAVTKNVGDKIYRLALKGDIPQDPELIDSDDLIVLKRRIFAMRREILPPVVTHNMVDSESNPILSNLRRLHLFNAKDDRVKVIYHPEFLNANSPVLGLEYDDFVRGCHLGVFPSYYEPWGYTPAECAVLGVPSVTTNLSGFGCFIEENIANPKDYGVYIVDRRLKSVEESVQQLTEYLFEFCQKSRRQRISLRNRTERLSDVLDWKQLVIEYKKAHQLALVRKFPDLFAKD